MEPELSKFQFVDTHFMALKLIKSEKAVNIDEAISKFCKKLDIGRHEKGRSDVRVTIIARNLLQNDLLE
jgi:hypothetical protein